MRSVPSILNKVGYALIWLVLIFTAIFVPAGLLSDVLTSAFADEIGSPSGSAVELAINMMLIIAALLAIVVWIYVLWRRLSLRWLKWPALGALAMLLLQLFSFPVVSLIGAGKLFIESVGRLNVFARSRLSCGKMAVAPRGLVEYESYD
jgi:hypothetical protein